MNDEVRMSNVEGITNAQMTNERSRFSFRDSDFVVVSPFVISHSSLVP
ncbi:MAG TPA: hypothetical protein VJ248_00760 [Candidatus Udaeobacter sp.]|nr:hypothetical protein [Candidatus Udaeobacter sp.]